MPKIVHTRSIDSHGTIYANATVVYADGTVYWANTAGEGDDESEKFESAEAAIKAVDEVYDS